jgi:hypothetical protein
MNNSRQEVPLGVVDQEDHSVGKVSQVSKASMISSDREVDLVEPEVTHSGTYSRSSRKCSVVPVGQGREGHEELSNRRRDKTLL